MKKLGVIAAGGVLVALGGLGFIVPADVPADVADDHAPAIAPDLPALGPDEPPVIAAAAPVAEPAAASVSEAAGASEREPALATITGSASYYADKFEGRTTASGVPFRQARLWAAHKTLPFGTRLRVTNLANGSEVEVEVVDRGPFAYGRVLDLSRTAAQRLDFIRSGHTRVKIEVLEKP